MRNDPEFAESLTQKLLCFVACLILTLLSATHLAKGALDWLLLCVLIGLQWLMALSLYQLVEQATPTTSKTSTGSRRDQAKQVDREEEETALADYLDQVAGPKQPSRGAQASSAQSDQELIEKMRRDELISAMKNLGYRSTAQAIAEHVMRENPGADLETLIRAAIKLGHQK